MACNILRNQDGTNTIIDSKGNPSELYDDILQLVNNYPYTTSELIPTDNLDNLALQYYELSNTPEFRSKYNLTSKLDVEVSIDDIINHIRTEYSFNENVEQGVKEGVEKLFNTNPELATIGTQEQYSQYLDTIFPDSKVKDILYHGSHTDFTFRDYISSQPEYTGSITTAVWVDGVRDDDRSIIRSLSDAEKKEYQKNGRIETGEGFYQKDGTIKYFKNSELDKLYNEGKFEKFKKRDHSYAGMDTFLGTGNYFTTSLKDAKSYARNKLYTVIANIKNAYTENKGYSNSRSGKGSQELIDKGYDAVTEKINNGQEYNIFEPEQIHILGNQNDIEGFKEFVGSNVIPEVETVSDFGVNTTIDIPKVDKLSDEDKRKELDILLNAINKLKRDKVYSEKTINTITQMMRDIGFNIGSFEEIVAKSKKPYLKKENAIVDITAKMIHLSEGGTVSDLLEEIGHIISAQLDGSQFEQALEIIKNDPKYTNEMQKYISIYQSEEKYTGE
ncbi:hypothetical protein EB118_18400, partial [bacterium]|nr:hypothetical protein [bacterium]